MLGAFRTTLHRTLTNKSCPKRIKTSLNRTFCMQSCLELQKQHYVRFFGVIMSLEILSGQYCTDKSPVQCCPRGSKQYWKKKMLSSVVLIPTGQHYTSKNPIQCCSCGLRKQSCSTGKNPVQCCGNLLGQHCPREAQCEPRSSRQNCTGIIPVHCCVNAPGTTLHRRNPIQCCLRGSR